MTPQLDDTIVALSSAPGRGGRAIVRLSGPLALSIVESSFHSPNTIDPQQRHIHTGFLALGGVSSPIPAELYLFPAPRSYTGQLVVELHLLSSPPLVEQLIADLLSAGARAAQPGEFTLRGFLAGKHDLPRAEAVLGTIEANDRNELQASLQQLAGGVSRPLDGLRDDLLNLLADFEAGMDFAEEDLQFVAKPQVLIRLAKGMAQVTLLQKQLRERALPGKPFRVALVGPPNVGKSCLFNALTGSDALVSAVPGTTRDYLVARLDLHGLLIELIDTAGLRETNDEVEAEAHSVGKDAITRVDLLLLCQTGDAALKHPINTNAESIPVATKIDAVVAPSGLLATSAVRGDGVDELKTLLLAKAKARRDRGLAPSLSRCGHHIEACLDHLRKAHNSVLFDDPAEIAALDLRAALDQLGEMTGAIYTDDLLDRVFSRFCIGK
jgi:tRNA modification GTPase